MNAATPSLTDAMPQLLLEHHLKHLRLPTILREYDKAARQCDAESIDYPDAQVASEHNLQVSHKILLCAKCLPTSNRPLRRINPLFFRL
jgi:hypothetical protein